MTVKSVMHASLKVSPCSSLYLRERSRTCFTTSSPIASVHTKSRHVMIWSGNTFRAFIFLIISRNATYYKINGNLHWGNAKANVFLWSLSLLNGSIKLDSLWTHLDITSILLSRQYIGQVQDLGKKESDFDKRASHQLRLFHYCWKTP